MMPNEKDQLLTLLENGNRWCREAEAQDAKGDAVQYADDDAVAWDITGALCRLFGWTRACALFEQLDRHIHGKRVSVSWPVRDGQMDAMAALQEFNDRPDTTFETLRVQLETLPVWRGVPGAMPQAQASVFIDEGNG